MSVESGGGDCVVMIFGGADENRLFVTLGPGFPRQGARGISA